MLLNLAFPKPNGAQIEPAMKLAAADVFLDISIVYDLYV
jgi:hypothetical protein